MTSPCASPSGSKEMPAFAFADTPGRFRADTRTIQPRVLRNVPAVSVVMYGVAGRMLRSMRRRTHAVARFDRETQVGGAELVQRPQPEARRAFAALGNRQCLLRSPTICRPGSVSQG